MHKPLTSRFLVLMLVGLAGFGAYAQSVYRIVGPDGKVTFSDRPPADAQVPLSGRTSSPSAAASAGVALPYELRQIANRFPVTIYTGADCAPCVSLRNLLLLRGVPFTERTVASNEDIAALERLSGNSSLPFGAIGGQQLSGYSDADWTQYLDAAGYPKQSQLPSNYRQTPATPLVAVKAAVPTPPAPSTAKEAPPVRPTPVPPQNSGPIPSNPAGIRF